MARATNTKVSTRKPRTTVTEEAPKRKPGRPVGSTNVKTKLSAVPAKATRPSPRRESGSKVAARAPKANKAELEAHVAKLERSIARLREKNKELKLAMTTVQDHVDALESQLAATPAVETPKPSRKSTRKAASSVATEPSVDEASS